jgi:pimeloyl-ACP methyl ester carboxylesterase
MSVSANRLRLVEAFRGIRRLPVSVVGHSIGSTINIGFGATTPRRYTKHRTGKRRTGYFNRAERDLFLVSATWEFRGPDGYSLRWTDNPRRIAREIEWFVGKAVIGATFCGPRQPAEIRFAGGATLRFWPDHSDDSGGWIFVSGRNYLPASDLHS